MADEHSLTVLHISDMQFGRHHQFGPEPDAPPNEFDKLLERIWDDIAGRQREEGLKPDLLICTGDLAEFAWSREFADATTFLGALADRLKLKRDRVVIIPGNHDVNRRDCLFSFEEFVQGGEPVVAPWYAKWKKYEKAFDDFYQSVPGAAFHPEQPWSLFSVPELEVVVAGLNSTWIEGHDWPDDVIFNDLKTQHQIAHAGWCGERQLRWFAEKLNADEFGGWLKIGAIHHNLERGFRKDNENLRDAEDLERVLGSHLHLVLHGHTHRARWGRIRELPWFATGSAGLKQQIRPYGVPNQYQFLVFNPVGIRVHARYYLPDEKMWADDPHLSKGRHIGIIDVPVGWRDVRRLKSLVHPNVERQPNPTERIKSVVHYAQEIVLKAYGGEYVVLREENGRKRLKACEKDIRHAQRFLILDFTNPNCRPEWPLEWPLEFGNQIVLQPIDDKNRFVSACEDLPPNFPLCVWGSRAENWERFTLKRPDSDEARASDKTVRFHYTARFQCHSGKWVWTNYNHTDNPLDGNVTTEPDRYENFILEEPSH